MSDSQRTQSKYFVPIPLQHSIHPQLNLWRLLAISGKLLADHVEQLLSTMDIFRIQLPAKNVKNAFID